ncbi:MAG: protein phosphatase 2C domain-containing protein [Saprospiraceae bacterium]|nr:protein phosphatase 2C domain-containing protein [Saprospiraceae bacterium]
MKTKKYNLLKIYAASCHGMIHEDGLCQDAFYIRQINGTNSIVALCDGAGSAKASKLAATFVSEKICNKLNAYLHSKKLRQMSITEWRTEAIEAVKQTQRALAKFAHKNKVDFHELACTLIVMIYTPHGIYTCHIGDGRGCYKSNDHWKPFMTPFKGEYSNETLFLNSLDFGKEDNHQYIFTNVVHEEVDAFALLSDGFENYCFNTLQKNEETGMYQDLNQPHAPFFDGMISTIDQLQESKITHEEIKKLLYDYVASGTHHIKNEIDDKTLVIGIMNYKKIEN